MTMTTQEIDRMVDEMTTGLPPLLSTAEVCALLRVGRHEIYRRVKLGEIAALRGADTGSSPLTFPRPAVRDYLRKRLIAGAS